MLATTGRVMEGGKGMHERKWLSRDTQQQNSFVIYLKADNRQTHNFRASNIQWPWVPGIHSLSDDIPLAIKFSYFKRHANLVFAEFYFPTRRSPDSKKKKIMTKDYFLIILLQFSYICVIDWIDISVNSHHVLMFPLTWLHSTSLYLRFWKFTT